jgi:hypothetical protein
MEKTYRKLLIAGTFLVVILVAYSFSQGGGLFGFGRLHELDCKHIKAQYNIKNEITTEKAKVIAKDMSVTFGKVTDEDVERKVKECGVTLTD